MIKGIKNQHVQSTVYRLAAPHDTTAIVSRRLSGVGAIAEAISFVGGTSTARDLVEAPFQAKAGVFKRPPTRFSDGSWPVFYSALEVDTAAAEVVHHYKKFWGSRRLHLAQLECLFSGSVKDLREKKDKKNWAGLTNPDTGNPFCKSIGKEAIELKVAALLAPSVRRKGGTNCVVFGRASLSMETITGEVQVDLASASP